MRLTGRAGQRRGHGLDEKYWEIVDGLYWAPEKLGLKSVPRQHYRINGEEVALPIEFLNPDGPFYRRVPKAAAALEALQRREEPLNDILNIGFAIAADAVLKRLLFEPAGLRGEGKISDLGSQTQARYGWGSANVTQPDGFFTTVEEMLAVEIKLGTGSSAKQLAKYAYLLFVEERLTRRRERLGLHFIVPASRMPEFEFQYRDGFGEMRELILSCADGFLPSRIMKVIRDDGPAYCDVLDRMRVTVQSWTDLRDACRALAGELEVDRPGDATLHCLLDGLVAQIEAHGGTEAV